MLLTSLDIMFVVRVALSLAQRFAVCNVTAHSEAAITVQREVEPKGLDEDTE